MNSDKAEKGVSIISYGLLVMTVTHTFTHVFAGIPAALFPTLMKPTEFNLTIQQVGIIAAIPPLCSALLSIPMGLLSDKYGSKGMVLVSMMTAAIGSFIASQSRNTLMFIVAISLLTINSTIYHPAAYSFTTKLFKPKDRPKALGLHGAGGTFGMSIGPISLSILMGLLAFGWRQVYLFWFVPMCFGILAVLRIKSQPIKDVLEEMSEITEMERHRETTLLTFSLAMFLTFIGIRTVGMSMINSFLPIYLVNVKGMSESLSSFIYGSNYLMGLLAAPIGGFLASRFGEKRWLMGVLCLSYISLALAFTISHTVIFVIFYLASGFFYFLGMAANSSLMAGLSPSRQRGLGYALFFLPSSIMGAAAPIIAAYIGDAFGLTSIFFASIAVYIIGLVVLIFGVKLKST
jgi:MFS family permease